MKSTEDVYGVNSLGESLRFVLSGFGGRQVLVVVWHPSVLKAGWMQRPINGCSRSADFIFFGQATPELCEIMWSYLGSL